jgi:hypothetical protein
MFFFSLTMTSVLKRVCKSLRKECTSCVRLGTVVVVVVVVVVVYKATFTEVKTRKYKYDAYLNFPDQGQILLLLQKQILGSLIYSTRRKSIKNNRDFNKCMCYILKYVINPICIY